MSLVHADALGGGAALAFFSDLRRMISVRGAKFALPEVHRGLAGGGYLMPRLLGKQLAAEWVLLGRSFRAEDAQAMGLVNVVCEADELEAQGERIASELASLSPGGLAVAKKSLLAGLTMDLASAMDAHIAAQTEAFVQAQAGSAA